MRLRLEHLTWQELDGEIVLLDLEGSVYYRLNGSGALLWRRLAEGSERWDLVAALIEEYGIDPVRADADVEAWLAGLTAHRLLARPSR